MADLFPSFFDELSKIAAVRRLPDHSKAADKHFKDPNWPAFEKQLKLRSFQEAVRNHPDADAKLKRYIKNYGGYLTSKDTVGVVPSRTSSKMYRVKRLPSGRLGCNCKDWQYYHSVRKSDCDHIEELSGGLEKSSNPMYSIARGVTAARSVERSKKNAKTGKDVEALYTRLNGGRY